MLSGTPVELNFSTRGIKSTAPTDCVSDERGQKNPSRAYVNGLGGRTRICGPRDYESPALTAELEARPAETKIVSARPIFNGFGRGRTMDWRTSSEPPAPHLPASFFRHTLP